VLAAAAGADLGRALADSVGVEDQASVVQLLMGPFDELTRRGILLRLLERSSDEPGCVAVLAELCRGLGSACLIDAVSAAFGLPDTAVWGAVLDVLETAEAPRDQLGEFWLSAPSSFILEEGRKRKLFQRLGASGGPVLLNADELRREALTRVAADSAAGHAALAMAVRASRAEAFPDRTLPALFALLLQTTTGRSTLVELVDDRMARDSTRLAAMEVVARSPQLATVVLARQRSHLLDPEPVRLGRAAILKELAMARGGGGG